MPHGKSYSNIVETTHHTPVVKLNRLVPSGGGGATVLV